MIVIYLISSLILISGETQCTCSQVSDEVNCNLSSACKWIRNQCVSRNDTDQCIQLPLSKCRLKDECFYLNEQCVEFSSCQAIESIEYCKVASYRCISDGKGCVEIGACEQYYSKTACKNKSIDEKYCYWNNMKCNVVAKCSQLPLQLNSDKLCREVMETCTMNPRGGCQQAYENCEEYQFEGQCHTNLNLTIKCFWNNIVNKCLKLECNNIWLKTDEKCKQILSTCTSNGTKCIIRKQCHDALNYIGCVTDFRGNRCVFLNGKCLSDICVNAPQILTTYEECYYFSTQQVCIPRVGGGCKEITNNCRDHEQEDSCLSIVQCFWNINKCVIKECLHAPNIFIHSQCQQWDTNLDCIGQLNSGCTARPEYCEQILNLSACSIDKSGIVCFINPANNRCEQYICTNLKPPLYASHSDCSKRNCIFNSQLNHCVEHICNNIDDQSYCIMDKNGSQCKSQQLCKLKQCYMAPHTLQSHQDCEQWLSNCTVAMYIFQTQALGCVIKELHCFNYLFENQCYETLNKEWCVWSQNRCQARDCSNSNCQTMECCQKWKNIGYSCLLGIDNHTCQDWPLLCSELLNYEQCQQGLENGEQCYWLIDQCIPKTCENAPIQIITNLGCREWFSKCILSDTKMGCQDQIGELNCFRFDQNESYNTHQQCNLWNPLCTIGELDQIRGCQDKVSCDMYKFKIVCLKDENDRSCGWVNNKCISVTQCDHNTSDQYYPLDCSNSLSSCTLNITPNYLFICWDKESKCEDYIDEIDCKSSKTDANHNLCYWNKILMQCVMAECEDNQLATTLLECYNFLEKQRCQLHINEDGSDGIGCESKPSTCSTITSSQKCNKTTLITHKVCSFINGICRESIDNITQCYDLISQDSCDGAILDNGASCFWNYSRCYENSNCNIYYSHETCIATLDSGIKCRYVDIYWACSVNNCIIFDGETPDHDSCYQFNSNCYFNGIICEDAWDCDVFLTELHCLRSKPQYGFKRCYWTGSSCVQLKCEHQTTAIGEEQESICYYHGKLAFNNFYYNYFSSCIKNQNGAGCQSLIDCSAITNKLFCINTKYDNYYNCLWQKELGCVKEINCNLNQSAISESECLLTSSICGFQIIKGYGCGYINCLDIPNEESCNSSIQTNGQKCQWEYECLTLDLQQTFTSYEYCDGLTKQQCNQGRAGQQLCFWVDDRNFCEYFSNCWLIHDFQTCQLPQYNCNLWVQGLGTTKCTSKKINCSDYFDKIQCYETITNHPCMWFNGLCQDLNCTQIPNSQCSNIQQRCAKINNSCESIPANCSVYTSKEICDLNSNSSGNTCGWFQNSCQEHTCSTFNYSPYYSPTVQQCQQWDNCGLSNDICIEQYSQCSSYGVDCSTQNVQKNSNGIECVLINGECTERTCLNYPYLLFTHFLCQNWQSACTVNANADGCTPKIHCSQAPFILQNIRQCEQYMPHCTSQKQQCDYLSWKCDKATQQQCYKNRLGNNCYWNVEQQKCLDLLCSNIDKTINTHLQCQSIYSACTISPNNECTTKLVNCEMYELQQQCQTDLSNEQCFWLHAKCYTKSKYPDLCVLSITMPELLCEEFHPDCRLQTVCSFSVCEDYYFKTDKECQLVMPEQQCTSNGIKCVERKSCREATSITSCTFSKDYQQCTWVQSTCQIKQCENAPNTYINDQQCLNYFSDCISKEGGGCTLKSNCESIRQQSSCLLDINNQICIWQNNKCQSYFCTPKCGDGIVSIGFEQCDDGNEIQFDGCFNCQFQCQEGCSVCYSYQCLLCYKGWTLNGLQCQSICGDGIIVGYEECDSESYCQDCKIKCSEGCTICQQGKCYACQQGWQLNEFTKCILNCGDNYRVELVEECDDGNYENNDGCSNMCLIEEGWTCIFHYSQQYCAKQEKPSIILNEIYTSKYKSKVVIINFNQEMKLYHKLRFDFLDFWSFNVSEDCLLEIVEIVPASINLQQIQIQLKIDFLNSVEQPILTVKLSQNIIKNEMGQELKSFTQNVSLHKQLVLSSTSKIIAKLAIDYSQILIYILVTTAGLSIITRNTDLFFNLIDQLQMLTYLRYINVNFPPQLEQFLETLNSIQLTALFTDLSDFYPANQIQQFEKIVDSFKTNIFIINVATQILICIFFHLFYCFNRYFFIKLYFQYYQQMPFNILKKAKKIMKQIQKFVTTYYYSGLFRLFLLIHYDIIFCSYLQLSVFDWTIFEVINVIMAGSVIFFQFKFILYVAYKHLNGNRLFKIRQCSSLYEGIHTTRSGQLFYPIMFLKRNIYILALIKLQQNSIIQISVIVLDHLLYFFYLLKFKVLIQKVEYWKQLISVITIAIAIFPLMFLELMSDLFEMAIGWYCIILFTSLLTFRLFVDVLEQFYNMYKSVYNKK